MTIYFIETKMKISLLLPKGTDVAKTRQFIREEQGTARNIKDRVTRNSVVTNLGKIAQFL